LLRMITPLRVSSVQYAVKGFLCELMTQRASAGRLIVIQTSGGDLERDKREETTGMWLHVANE